VSSAAVLDQLARLVLQVERSHPVRVAVDGVSADGKTTLADALGGVLECSGRPVIRAEIDHFEAARERYRRRYIPAEKLYLRRMRPHERADVVVDNTDFAAPRLTVRRATR
jgi:uridine kinase